MPSSPPPEAASGSDSLTFGCTRTPSPPSQGISGPILTFLAGAIFDKVDYNKNGVIEDVEVEVAILQLYHQINR